MVFYLLILVWRIFTWKRILEGKGAKIMIIESIPYVVPRGTDSGKRRVKWRLQCNVCSKEFIRKPSRVKYRRTLHFCSRKCVDKAAHTKQMACSGKKCTNFVSITRYRKTKYCISCDRKAFVAYYKPFKAKYMQEYYVQNAETIAIKNMKHYAIPKNRLKKLAYMKSYKQTEQAQKLYQAWYLEYRKKNGKILDKRNRENKQKHRDSIIKLMGGKCKCCGETDPIYFHFDHVHNDGHIDRKNGNNRIGLQKYLTTPEKYQLLCANCNHAKRMNGGKIYKPKKKRKR